MSTDEFIISLFDRVDDAMRDVPKHPDALLYPSELVTLALLYALKGVGPRAFYRWLVRDYRPLFPRLPERTRLHCRGNTIFLEREGVDHTLPDNVVVTFSISVLTRTEKFSGPPREETVSRYP